MKRPNKCNNPWNLTRGQCDALDALVKNYCDKRAAVDLGITEKAVSLTLGRAKQRMGASTRLQMVLTWDRYMRMRIEEEMQAEWRKAA